MTSEKRDYIIKYGMLGLVGAMAFSAGSYLWEKDFFLGEEPKKRGISSEQLEAMQANSKITAEIRKLVQPCYGRANDMINSTVSRTTKVPEILEKSDATRIVCEEQLGNAEAMQIELADRQQLAFDKCKSSLELEIQFATQFADTVAKPEKEVSQADEDQITALGGRVKAQRTACETSLSESQVIGQIIGSLEG